MVYLLCAMDIKKIDKALDVSLWVLFGILLVVSFFFCRSVKAPNIEIIESTVKFPYEYSSDDGEKYESYYVLAWEHKAFSSPKLIVVDPNNGNTTTLKPKYVEEYKSQVPETKYPFYTRWTILMFIVLAVISALIVYYGFGAVRDLILYLRLRHNPNFSECAYFLYEDRVAFKPQVRRLIPINIGKYISAKSRELYSKYRKDFADLLIRFLYKVEFTGSTDVSYYLTYKNLTTDQNTYLERLRSYWDGKIGTNPDAEDNVRTVNKMIGKSYLPINLLITESDISYAVSKELDKLFMNILGGEVLRFYGYDSSYAKQVKPSGDIFIDINVYNHTKTFTWSGSAVLNGTSIPGLEVEFKIFHYVNKQEVVLWQKFLVPQCAYSASDDTFSSSELYKSMVLSTINSFNQKENLK